MKIPYILLLLFLILNNFQSFSQIIYVDNKLSEDCIGNYSISNRDCSGSDGDAYATFSSAANAVNPGGQVLIRGGYYRDEQLTIVSSGDEDNFITFKNYGDEEPIICGASLAPAIYINQKNYIIIEGLTISAVDRWLNVLGSHDVIIRNNDFENAINDSGSSKTGLFFQSCDHIQIINNVINQSTEDNIGLINSDYNLIEGNTITRAKHVLWTLKCSNYNIIRGNYFHNEIQKIGEIYDCDAVGYGSGTFPKITSLDDTKYNVVENNIFAYTASSGNSSPYCGIQLAAQHTIVRNNSFYECVGPPIDLTYYSDEAQYNYGNRISHNVFFDNDFGGITISGTESANFGDQQIKNNIFYKNQFIENDTRWSWYDELNNKPVQIFIGRYTDILFENNDIFSSEVDELYTIAYGSRNSSSNDAPQTLSWWETNHSDAFVSNLQVNPDFVDEGNKDFSLQETSPMVDAGVFLTKTTNSGTNSTQMVVDDAGWFIDGFDIVSGDIIQLEGQSTTATILSINYTTNTLLLDKAISWEVGQGISRNYTGLKPDLGAFEYSDVPAGFDQELNDNNEIQIFPNPTKGLLYIDVSSGDILDEISLYNGMGQNIVHQSNTSELDISQLENGIYYVSIVTVNGNTEMKKILKY